MKTTTRLLIGLVLIGVAGFVYFNAQPKQDGRVIRIGAPLSLSGDAVSDGESMKKGLELARADLAKKGINVEIVYQDDKTDPKGTVAAINALHTQGVEALIGPTWSYLADAGVPVADSFKLVNIQPGNTSEYVSTNGSPYTFFTTQKVARMVPPLAQWMKDNNIKKIAMIESDGAWYSTVDKAVREAAALAGAQVVLDEIVPFGINGPTMSTLVTKVKTSQPDLFFTEIDDEGGIVAMLKKTQDLNFQIPIMSITSSINRILNEYDEVTLKNKIYIVAPQPSKAFEEKYASMYGSTPMPYADRAYDSLMLLVDAIEHKGETPLAEYLRTQTHYKGYVGTYAFDEKGDITGGEWGVNTLR